MGFLGGVRVQNRRRLLKGANALLYFGPLLAGLGGFGWGMVPAFAAIFMLWLVIIRPQDFPRTRADWMRPEALLMIASRALVQLLLVLLCFGIGRGLGGVVGALPPFPIMLPLSISFLSIPLARMIWDPWQVHEMDQLLDKALADVESSKAAPGGDRAYAAAVLAPLSGLADTVSEAELENHLSALRALVDEPVSFDVLLEKVTSGDASVSVRRALMVLGSNGAALGRMGVAHAPARVMRALGLDAPLIGRMAERLVDALQQDPAILQSYPEITYLDGLRGQLPDAAAALSQLQTAILEQAPRD